MVSAGRPFLELEQWLGALESKLLEAYGVADNVPLRFTPLRRKTRARRPVPVLDGLIHQDDACRARRVATQRCNHLADGSLCVGIGIQICRQPKLLGRVS